MDRGGVNFDELVAAEEAGGPDLQAPDGWFSAIWRGQGLKDRLAQLVWSPEAAQADLAPMSLRYPSMNLEYIPTDPLFANQWHLRNATASQVDINVEEVWDDYTGHGVIVTVIDNGFEVLHPDLDGNYDHSSDYDYEDADFDAQAEGGESHGTAVMGIIGAEADNGIGGVGVAFGATLRGYRGLQIDILADQILDAAGIGDGLGNTNGDNGTGDVVNMSFGIFANGVTNWNFNNDMDAATAAAFLDAVAGLELASANGRGGLGTIHVKSSGNNRGLPNGDSREEGTADVMDATKYTINVAALRQDGWIDSISTPGANVLISVPTDNIFGSGAITTTDRIGTAGYNGATSGTGGDYAATFGGTSSAAPQIAGVVALMLEANPDLGWRDVQKILAYSAVHVGSDVGASANTGAPVGGGFEQGTQVLGGGGASWFWNGATNWNGGGLHFSNDYGYGLVDAKAAVRLAETWAVQSTSANEVSNGAGLDMDGPGLTNHGSAWTVLTATEATDLTINHVRLNVDFSIDNMNDMQIWVTSPAGTMVQFISGTGGMSGNQNAADWDFGSTAFMGESSAGEWTVEIRNQDGSGAGIFQTSDVDLYFTGDAATDDDVFVFTNELSDHAGVDGHGTASFDGGAGTDTFNATAVDADAVIDLGANSAIIDGVTLSGVLNINHVHTGDGDDTIIGDDVTELLSSGRGADQILGGTADEAIYGGDGDDDLGGGAGNDTLTGGDGADSLDGGAGLDTADYSGADDTLIVFMDGTAGIGGAADGDMLARIEHVIGGSGVDNIFGSTGNDTIEGRDGNDVLISGLGSDLILGGAGIDILSGVDGGVADTLDGGVGSTNIAYYFDATGDQVVDMGDHGNLATNQGEHTADTWINITGFYGADGFTNHVTGDDSINELLGGSLGDQLYGGANGDVLVGLAGDDRLFGGTEGDVLAGGSGTDTLVGGAGGDAFYIQTGNQVDIVADWDETSDVFLFFRTGVANYGDLVFTDTGTDVEITSLADSSFTVIVQAAEFSDLDQVTSFVFV